MKATGRSRKLSVAVPRSGRRTTGAGQVTPRRVLVATDGSEAARAALKLARWMEQRGEWAPEVLTVFEPVPVSVADVALAPPSAALQQVATDSAVARLMQQVKRNGSAAWKLNVEFGRVAPTIAEIVREKGAALVVTGLGRHGKLARLFGAETASRLARRIDVPLLAVDGTAKGAPRSALVAMDFGPSALHAAREALDLLERPARLHLVHVRWAFEGQTMRDPAWERTYADGVDVAFARLIDQLGPQPGVRITSEMKLGSVVETLIATAKKMKADVIAAGSHNQTLLDRMLLGSTSALLLRAAACSVLIAPPGDGVST